MDERLSRFCYVVLNAQFFRARTGTNADTVEQDPAPSTVENVGCLILVVTTLSHIYLPVSGRCTPIC